MTVNLYNSNMNVIGGNFSIGSPTITGMSISVFSGSVGSSTTVTTNTLVAPANSLLVLSTTNNYYTPTSIAVTSSPSLTWTTAISGNGNGFMQGIYTAPFTAGGTIDVTTTTFGGTGLVNGTAVLYAVINANASPIGTTHIQQDLFAQPIYSLTTTRANSLIFCMSVNINSQYTPTGGTYVGSAIADFSNRAAGAAYLYHYQAAAIAAYSIGMTGTFTASNFYSCFAEIKGL